MIYIFSSKNESVLKRALGNTSNKKNSWAMVLSSDLAKQDINSWDQVYLDVSCLSPSQIKKNIALLKESRAFWGIIDPKGTVPDPASFFFQGAGDYIGKVLVSKGLDKKRFLEALAFAAERRGTQRTGREEGEAADKAKKKGQTLASGKFPGWKSIRTGTQGVFLFLFVSVSGKSNLRTLIGEKAFGVLKSRLRDFLQQNLKEFDALFWMETEDSNLYLVPPRIDNCRAAIEKALKIILNSRLIGIENLGMTIPIEFTFALHYGQTIFKAPGKTGDIISESLNFIFHLGAKKAEAGRLTISGAVPDEAIPAGLIDFFRSTGTLEGISLSHSRRFVH